jgi:hypothetical protein
MVVSCKDGIIHDFFDVLVFLYQTFRVQFRIEKVDFFQTVLETGVRENWFLRYILLRSRTQINPYRIENDVANTRIAAAIAASDILKARIANDLHFTDEVAP